MHLGECLANYHTKEIQKLILQNHIFKDVNIDELLEYNVFLSLFVYKIISR